ncbi:MAG: hypothetical protein A2W37_16310 [Chloroflexi bacterium RBG_16_63_12]|nr:MAG: hypothetical protein A2W37_16310 [Chloroflexi bacterium RBG_16_63_12]
MLLPPVVVSSAVTLPTTEEVTDQPFRPSGEGKLTFTTGGVASSGIRSSITETLWSPLATYTRLVLGITATPPGACTTGTVATIVFVAPSMIETLLLPLFAT